MTMFLLVMKFFVQLIPRECLNGKRNSVDMGLEKVTGL